MIYFVGLMAFYLMVVAILAFLGFKGVKLAVRGGEMIGAGMGALLGVVLCYYLYIRLGREMIMRAQSLRYY